jgi:hypothetical protein
MPEYRSDQALIQVSVAGILSDTVAWDSFSGGDTGGTTTNRQPGGMGSAYAMGGPQTRNPITLGRIWSDVLFNVYKQLDQATNRARVTVKVTTLDANGRTTGPTTTYSGVLATVTRPEYDSSSSGEGRLQITVDSDFAIS